MHKERCLVQGGSHDRSAIGLADIGHPPAERNFENQTFKVTVSTSWNITTFDKNETNHEIVQLKTSMIRLSLCHICNITLTLLFHIISYSLRYLYVASKILLAHLAFVPYGGFKLTKIQFQSIFTHLTAHHCGAAHYCCQERHMPWQNLKKKKKWVERTKGCM